MKKYKLFVILIGFAFSCLQQRGYATVSVGEQEAVAPSIMEDYHLRKPDEQFIQKCRDDAAFNYTPKETNDWVDRLERWLLKHLPGIYYSNTGNGQWFIVVLNLLALGVVVFVIYKLIHTTYSSPFSKKVRKSEIVSAIEVQQVDQNSYPILLEQALQNKDYTLAIRIQYWYVLRLLDQRGIIHWNEHYSNARYWREITQAEMKDPFKRLSQIFDCVCYGEFLVDRELYEQLAKEFQDFQKQLGV